MFVGAESRRVAGPWKGPPTAAGYVVMKLPADAAAIAKAGKEIKIRYTEYDWALNDSSAR